MNSIAWSAGTWTREPVSTSEKNGTLVVEAVEGSDWWRTTSYGFIHNDGHALTVDFPNESAMEVSFILDYTEQDSFAERFAQRVGVMFGMGIRSAFPEFGTSQRVGFQ